MLVVVLVGGTFAEKPQMTQAEADVVVEREMFKFIHHDDWMDAIKYWKERGITDEMFAESYAKIARRTKRTSHVFMGRWRWLETSCQ